MAAMHQGNGTSGAGLALTFPPELVDTIARRAVELLREQVPATPASPYLTVEEAANYLRCTSKQRIYDLVHQCALAPRRDGKRLLFHRDTLDSYLADGAA